MELTSVLIKPYMTEKTEMLRENTKSKRYAFIVHKKASKKMIALAFESLFGLEPLAVNTINRKANAIKTGTMFPGTRKSKKIAYITLQPGQDINLSQDEFDQKQETEPTTALAKAVNKIVNSNQSKDIKKTLNKTPDVAKKIVPMKEKQVKATAQKSSVTRKQVVAKEGKA